jgi:hypothetical protein
MWSVGPCPTTYGSLERVPVQGIVFVECWEAIRERHANQGDAQAFQYMTWGCGGIPNYHWDSSLAAYGVTDFDRQKVTWGNIYFDWVHHELIGQLWQRMREWFDFGGPLWFAPDDSIAPNRWSSRAEFLTEAIGAGSWDRTYDEFYSDPDRAIVRAREVEEIRMCIEHCLYYSSSRCDGTWTYGDYGYGNPL